MNTTRRNVAPFPAEDQAERQELMNTPLHTDALQPQTIGQALEWARLLHGSSLVPKSIESAADVLVAILWGRQLGMSVVQALQNIAVVNGRATIWGDAYFAIVLGRARAELEKFEETWEAEKDGGTWTTTVKRTGLPEITRTFSIGDAKKITYFADGNRKLLADKDTYKNYPRRMCKFKARNEALRDTFPDLLLGIGLREEADEYEERRVGESATPAAERQAAPLAELLAVYDPDVAASIVRGFDELALSTAERRVKLREYGDNSAGLLSWLKEEYTLRKTAGAQRAPRPGGRPGRRQAVEQTAPIDVPVDREPRPEDDPRTDDQAAREDAAAARAEETRETPIVETTPAPFQGFDLKF